MAPSELPKPMVFFSHSSRDAEWVEHLANQARAVGVDVYLAASDVSPGKSIAAKVVAALKASSAVMVLITPNSIGSPYVNQEIGGALLADKYVVPVVTADVADKDLSLLAGTEYILLDPDSPQDALARITSTLSKILDHQRESFRLAAKQRREDALALGALLLLLGLMLIADKST